MLLVDAYKNLTKEAKDQVKDEILALCEERELQCSRGYLSLLLQGLRKAPCGPELARLISGYMRGMIGLDVSPQDVLDTVKKVEGVQ